MTDPTSVPDAGELDSLLGAYALDALDATDRARVDAYLQRDANARAEVDDMRETAASLALLPDTPMEAPPALWARIADTIAADRAQEGSGPAPVDELPVDELPVDELTGRRSRRARWIAPLAVAAAIAIVAVLGGEVASLRGQLHDAHRTDASAMAAAFDRAAKVDGARAVRLQSSTGATLARVVLLPDGTGYLRGDDLKALPPDQTYQLWAVAGSKTAPVVVSAGVLGPDPSAVAFRASGPVHGFAVTVEQAGGVVTSHNRPVASAQLS